MERQKESFNVTLRFLIWAANWVGSDLQEEEHRMYSRQLDNMV